MFFIPLLYPSDALESIADLRALITSSLYAFILASSSLVSNSSFHFKCSIRYLLTDHFTCIVKILKARFYV